jgi:hypothetical protein
MGCTLILFIVVRYKDDFGDSTFRESRSKIIFFYPPVNQLTNNLERVLLIGVRSWESGVRDDEKNAIYNQKHLNIYEK